MAVKVLSPSRVRDPAGFTRDSKAAVAIDHPHVVTIYRVGEHGGVPCIMMQLLGGCTLAAHCQAVVCVPVPEVLRIGREITAGLAAVHGRSLVHRDLKPDNVLLEGATRSVRIIDFGLTRGLGEEITKITIDGVLATQPPWRRCSPTRHGASPAPDPRTR